MLLLACAIILLSWLKSQQLTRKPNLPPGTRLPSMPPLSSFIGHLELLDPVLYKKAVKMAKEYGPVFRLQLFSREVVIVNDFDSLKAFGAAKELLYRPPEMNRGRECYNGILTLNGDMWTANRRLCLTVLRDLGFANDKMEQNIMKELQILKEKIENRKGEPVPVSPYITECLTCNIASFFYGSSIPKNSAIRSDFNGVLRKFLEVFGVLDILDFVPRLLQQALGYFSFTSIYKGQVLMKELDEFIIKEIIEKSHEDPDDLGENFLRLFREKIRASYHSLDPMLEYTSLVGNVKSLIGAGVVTASSSVLFHLANFAAHADTLQDRVQREIDDVIGPDREPTWSDRMRMPFTLACIYEAERCGESVPLGLPRVCNEDAVVDKYFIPKGTLVLMNLWGINNDPRYWKDPQRFNPLRYLSADGSFSHQTTKRHAAFSSGRRSCPGESYALMMIFLMLTYLLQKYRIVNDEPLPFDCEQDFGVYDLKKLKVRFLPRCGTRD